MGIPPPCQDCGKKFKYYVEYTIHNKRNHNESITDNKSKEDEPVAEAEHDVTESTNAAEIYVEDSDSEYLDIELDEDEDDLIPDLPLIEIDEQLEYIPLSTFSEENELAVKSDILQQKNEQKESEKMFQKKCRVNIKPLKIAR